MGAFKFAFSWVDGGVGNVWLFTGSSLVCLFPLIEVVVLALALAVAVGVGVASGVTYCEINWSVASALVRSTKGRSVVYCCETRRVFEMEVPWAVCDRLEGRFTFTYGVGRVVGGHRICGPGFSLRDPLW